MESEDTIQGRRGEIAVKKGAYGSQDLDRCRGLWEIDAMKQSPVYLDYNATTPPSDLLKSQVETWWGAWGNPSSIHGFGRGPKRILRESRRSLAKILGIHPLEIIFTSGGSEANNLAIKGLLSALKESGSSRRRVLVSSIEHPSVHKTMVSLKAEGYEVVQIPVDRDGHLDLDFYERHLDENVAMVSSMIANNEVGVLLPVTQMVAAAKKVGAYFHTDCVQALGKMEFDLSSLGVDLATFSGHKLYALKGAGVLYAKKGTPMLGEIHGGAQERGRRAGTENLLAIASLCYMVEKLKTKPGIPSMGSLRDTMESRIEAEISGVEVLAKQSPRLPNTSCLTLDGVDGEALMMNLDISGFAVSTGAACSSGNPEPSPVLLAMGLSRAEAQSSLRVSLGEPTTMDEVFRFVETLKQVVAHLRALAKNNGEDLHV